jgi:hypothetical protein
MRISRFAALTLLMLAGCRGDPAIPVEPVTPGAAGGAASRHRKVTGPAHDHKRRRQHGLEGDLYAAR